MNMTLCIYLLYFYVYFFERGIFFSSTYMSLTFLDGRGIIIGLLFSLSLSLGFDFYVCCVVSD